MIVVNLFGPPSSGKSTGSAYIFSALKLKNINAELVTEYAKDLVWENNHTALSNQAYIFGNQYYRVDRLRTKVDIVITDSPVLLSCFYNSKNNKLGNAFPELVLNAFNSFNNVNYLIKRDKPYNPIGRLQTERESDAIYLEIEKFLNEKQIPYDKCLGNIAAYDYIVEDVVNLLKG